MTAEEYFEVLKGAGEMSRLSDDELRKLISVCEPKVLQAREPLWGPSDIRTEAYVLVSGRIERAIRGYAGRVTEQENEAGAILSISALVRPWPYHSAAYATERTELLTLSRGAFSQMFDARDSVAYALTDAIGEYLVRDMRKANERLQEVFGRPAETLMMLRRRVRDDAKA